MHSKLILVRRSTYADVDFRGTPAWAYVGSANLSESAWYVLHDYTPELFYGLIFS